MHKVILLMLLTILIGIHTLDAQTPTAQSNALTPIYIGGLLTDVAWSNDSQQLTFVESGPKTAVEMSSPQWFDYDVTTKTVSERSRWPLQPSLTQDELDTFAPFAANQLSFIFESPNHRYLVFARGDEVFPLTLADRLTKQVMTLIPVLHIPNPTAGPESFRVLFSADSSTFTVMYATDFSDEYSILYVSDYASKITDASNILVGDIGQDLTASYLRVEDISADNTSLLLSGIPLESASSKRHFYLWNADNLTSLDISPHPELDIQAAAFSSPRDDTLLMVTDIGLIQYNYASNQTQFIRSDIASAWVTHAYFSPSAETVALVKQLDGSTELYVVNLTNALH